MTNKIASLIATFLLTFSVSATERKLPKDLLPAVHGLTENLTDGYAKMYVESATYVSFHGLPWRGASDGAVVLYYMGGWGLGNTNEQVLAVFARNEKLDEHTPPPANSYRLVAFTVVGEKGGRALGNLSIKGSTIRLTGEEPGANNPMCCPSIPVVLRYTVRDHNLILVGHGG